MSTTNHSLPSDSDFARLEGELFARIDRRHRRQVLRHRLAAVAIVAVLAGAGIAAGTVANPSQESWAAYCYGSANTSSQVVSTVLSNRPKTDGANESARPPATKVARAVGQCGVLWRSGVFGPASSAAPKLQACLRDDLVIAVFPRKSTTGSIQNFCQNLGLSAP
jgi:hypothetical protein